MKGHLEQCTTGIYSYMTFSGCRTTMWSPRRVLLFLALVLIPDPGVSQFGTQFAARRCRDCRSYEEVENPAVFQYVIDGKLYDYVKCPHTDKVRFVFKNEKEIICAKKSLSWVKRLMEHIDEVKKCQQDGTCSNSQKEFSKGSNEKPSTTTLKAPTTAPLTSMKTSTKTWDHNIGHSSEPAQPGATKPTASLVTTSDSGTTPLLSNKANINLHQGHDKPSQDSNGEDIDSKMTHMKTAIISLIAIVLVMVAVGVGLYCRKKKTNKFNPPCGGRSIEYTSAPSEDL